MKTRYPSLGTVLLVAAFVILVFAFLTSSWRGYIVFAAFSIVALLYLILEGEANHFELELRVLNIELRYVEHGGELQAEQAQIFRVQLESLKKMVKQRKLRKMPDEIVALLGSFVSRIERVLA